ncbi:MAG: hypothetical protein RJA19_1284, partial [Bacteroidota bacterium]
EGGSTRAPGARLSFRGTREYARRERA